MEKEEIKNYVDDQVRLSTDSSIQALTNLLISHKKEIAGIVQDQIKITVNGKIDKLTEMVKALEPVKNRYESEINEEQVHKKDIKKVLTWIGIITGLGSTAVIIRQAIISFIK